MNNKEEYILCASNWYNDGKKYESQPVEVGFIICGRRHHNCISTFALIFGFPYNKKIQKLHNTEVQGFLTSKGRFVGRLEALKIARERSQIITGEGNNKLGLFSEDLY